MKLFLVSDFEKVIISGNMNFIRTHVLSKSTHLLSSTWIDPKTPVEVFAST